MKVNQIKSARTKAGFTQRELSRACGISERGYQAIENGETSPNVATALIIAEHLNETVENLFGEPNDQPA